MTTNLPPRTEAGLRRITKARERLAEERAWMAQCGGTLAGYIERYGSLEDPDHHGDGGEAIYAADLAAVQRWERELALLTGNATPLLYRTKGS
jgi:hypothetical protein